MDAKVVCLRGVSKRFGAHEAVCAVDLDIFRGNIYGLVGENGAGKSTLIRIINGLTKPTCGSVSLFGQTSGNALRAMRSRVGYMPDVNASYDDLSARDNLVARCLEWGISPKSEVDAILDLVGLSHAVKKRVGGFSMGMKRRLDLGIALLGNPEFLILDEPTNGLDPMGIAEVRQLLVRLNEQEGKTILISSHNLSELSKIATHFAFMSHGRLLRCLSAHDVELRCQGDMVLRVDSVAKACAVLGELLSDVAVASGADGTLRLKGCETEAGYLIEHLNCAGVRVFEAFRERRTLEDYYAEVIELEGKAS